MCGKLDNKLFILGAEGVDDSNIIDVCCVELKKINKHLVVICCFLLQIYTSCMVGVIYASCTTTCLVLIILKTLGLFGNYEFLNERGTCLSESFNCLSDNNLALFLCLGIVVWN